MVKNNRNIIVLGLVLLMTTASTELVAQDAKGLLDQVAQQVKSYSTIAIDFKWKLDNQKEQVSQETRGDVALMGEKYKLSMMGITRLFDGNKLYTIAPEDFEVSIAPYDPSEDKDITPSKLLTFYQEGYTYQWDITQRVGSRRIQYIKLLPIDANAEIKDLLLGIDLETKQIYKLIQTDDQGTRYTLTVQSFDTDSLITEQDFTLDLDAYQQQGYYINHLN
ncbi:MAG: outer membrane lipoprotein carrier protein LolA [Flavobacteriaceae bacterium]|nr:outer membrane lipoprotein carrier protein LolA [Flavobacteriaceae bacterium]MDG1961751.1 outer membrane lipoprotein carrier protein LolA [Flavobacteriaceae bacterium]